MEKGAHYFYALALPEDIKARMREEMKLLKGKLPFERWVHHEDLHVTLAFLGNAEETMLMDSVERIGRKIPELSPFNLDINHLGVFGTRVFWAGLKEQPLLNNARDLVFSSCMASGFKLETRPFSPHITIARKWAGEISFSRAILEKNDPFLQDPVKFKAEEIVLYRTRLGKVPKYEAEKTFFLAGD
ncbi:RNA 2',3'-cyclic phosphodiesterase [Mesobacillus zeae]|uniref:RNA 2',3'-cyclic phosphodiesterase n=1 Tax=Mesobacillus zeae TaxID=1917180 RepID=A0A398B5V9_9BACI|nr:RNA 2',3'-cyclic phosphodiesterase [Mesobacillus zeae]RID83083.1 RNA 2',3'-cyclic phosphodiesterase [Mesobacillus zeae]